MGKLKYREVELFPINVFSNTLGRRTQKTPRILLLLPSDFSNILSSHGRTHSDQTRADPDHCPKSKQLKSVQCFQTIKYTISAKYYYYFESNKTQTCSRGSKIFA